MTLAPLFYLPGVNKTNSDYAAASQAGGIDGRSARGRYRDMEGSRFTNGFPEKIGGCATATDSTTAGVPRGLRVWRDNNQVVRLAIGTNLKLYYFGQNLLTEITPWRNIVSGTLTNPFTTISTSATITVTHVAHGLVTGDYVKLAAGSAVAGLSIAGVFTNITRVDADNYTFVNISAANASTSGGGTVAYTYYRVTLTNPFTTISGSTTVTVTHVAHGASPNDYVTINGATAVGGLTLSGEYQIGSTSTNDYTITASSAASSGASGGGTPNLQYEISVGFADTSQAVGYGTGGYGQNGYGTTGTTSVTLGARVWSIWNYGAQILCSPYGGTIYVWDPTVTGDGRAYPLYNAPTTCLGFFVTPERFVIALGISGNLMQIAWPDQSDYTAWTSTTLNTANSGRTLQGGNYLVGGLPVRDGVSLISSDITVFSHSYTGDQNIYATDDAAHRCGFVGPLAATAAGETAYWMGKDEFWMFDGSVRAIPSDDIRDYVFRDINLDQAQKFVAHSIQAKKEIWFRYCSAASTEINRYVVYHVDQGCWSVGTVMPRTSVVDRDLFAYPMATDSSGRIYNQEYGVDDNGAALDSYIIAAPIDIAQGDVSMDVMNVEVDFERITGDGALSVLTRIYPNDTDTVDGPYTVAADNSTPRIDTRSNGKMAGFKYESNVVGGDWRLGMFRADISPAGARR